MARPYNRKQPYGARNVGRLKPKPTEKSLKNLSREGRSIVFDEPRQQDFTLERPFLALKKAILSVLRKFPLGCSLRALKEDLTAKFNHSKRDDYKLTLALETLAGVEIEIEFKSILAPTYRIARAVSPEKKREIELKEAREAKERKGYLPIFPTTKILPDRETFYGRERI